MSSTPLRSGLCCALFLLAFVSAQSPAEVTSLAVDPTTPGTVYAGTSEGGVLKSTDGGASWTRAGLTDTPVGALAIDRGSPSFLYALSSTGLFKSANGGDTWTAVLLNGSSPTWGMIERPFSATVGTLALARRIDPTVPATVHAGMTYAASDWFTDFVWGDVYTSTDGGQGWTSLYPDTTDPFSSPWMSAPVMAAAAATDTTPARLYTGHHPGINGYQVCAVSCSRIDQSPEGPAVLAVDPRNPHAIYAGMNGSGFYKSTDGGATWSGGGTAVVRALVLDPVNVGTLYAATANQGVLKSSDAGATWTAVNAGLEIDIRALAIDPSAPATIYAASAAGVFKSIDGGASWNSSGLMQRLQSVSVPAGVIGGNSGVGTVTLNAPAPEGGTAVSVSSTNPALASVPASVTVPAGATSAEFSIATARVTEGAVVTISASLDGLAKSAGLTVAPAIAGIAMSGQGGVAGMTLTGILVLGLPAPTAGATVVLTSSNPAVATVPATVSVPAGITAVNFPISTATATQVNMVTITADYGGDSRSMVIRIVPAAVSSLSLNPARVFGGSTSTGTVTLLAPAPTGGAVISLSSGNASVATVPASITVQAGATSASFTVSTSTVLPPTYSQIGVSIGASAFGSSAYQVLLVALPEATLSSVTLNPASMGGGSAGVGTVLLSMAAPAGGATVALSSSNPAVATVPASATVPMGATSANFPVSTSAVSAATTATISAAYGGANRSAVLNIVPATLASMSVSPASVSAGSASTGTVTLSVPAPAGGAAVSLASSAPAVAIVPAAVVVAAGGLSANFAITTVACTSGSATVSGTYGGMTQTAAFTVSSNADNVAIEQATYFANKRELRVAARGTDSSATLRVYVTSSGALIGAMRNLGDGRFTGQFTWPSNPQGLTVRSSSCGSGTGTVSSKG